MALTAEQVEQRKRGVGCSESLAALGKDSRCSRLELYKRKVGELPEPDFSKDERVRFGQLLEPLIRDEFARRMDTQIIVPQQTLIHPDAPLVGHPDGWMPALSAGVEIKTADKFEADEFGEEESDQVPVRYLIQCTGYMLLTKAQRWFLCVLIGGNELRVYEIAFNPEIADFLLAGICQFWKHVEQRRPPDPGTPEEVKLRWPKDLGTTVVATPEIADLCAQLATTQADLKANKSKEAEIKAQIQKFMEEAGQLVDSDGQLLATWRTARPSMKFDDKRFAIDQPLLHSKYLSEQPGSRRFLLK